MSKPLEVLKTDGLGRVQTPAERREKLLDEFEKSGLSGTKFAALAGIKYQTFASWRLARNRQRSAGPPTPATKSAETVRWMEAVVTAARPAPAGLKVYLPGGAWVEVSQAEQAPLVAALLHAMQQPVIRC